MVSSSSLVDVFNLPIRRRRGNSSAASSSVEEPLTPYHDDSPFSDASESVQLSQPQRGTSYLSGISCHSPPTLKKKRSAVLRYFDSWKGPIPTRHNSFDDSTCNTEPTHPSTFSASRFDNATSPLRADGITLSPKEEYGRSRHDTNSLPVDSSSSLPPMERFLYEVNSRPSRLQLQMPSTCANRPILKEPLSAVEQSPDSIHLTASSSSTPTNDATSNPASYTLPDSKSPTSLLERRSQRPRTLVISNISKPIPTPYTPVINAPEDVRKRPSAPLGLATSGERLSGYFDTEAIRRQADDEMLAPLPQLSPRPKISLSTERVRRSPSVSAQAPIAP